MSRFEMSLGDGALAVAYYKAEDGRVVLLHTEVPQELSGLGTDRDWHMAFSKRCDAMGKE
jgi:predicted GNAT family acetyltransferase